MDFDPRRMVRFVAATSLALIHDYLGARSSAGAVLLGIQPGRLRLGSALSEEVAAAVEAVASRVTELLAPEPGVQPRMASRSRRSATPSGR